MPNTPTQLTGKLHIDTALGNFLGDKRIRLLEAIDKCGSISQAAKAVPMSYKAAWDAVDDMNNVAPESLVNRSAGGRHGGGTELTAFARRLIAFYRALEKESQLALEKLTSNLKQSGVCDVDDFRQVLRRMSMKTSARNQFAGPVTSIKEGVVDTEVAIRLAPDLLLTAIFVLMSTMLLGALRPQRPWRWVLVVAVFVPILQLLAFLFLTEKPYRAQIYESFLGFLTGVAGAYGGSVGRRALNAISQGK